mgnify:FL=1
MKKIVALAFGICLMGGAVSAQTLDSKYGLDSVKTLENASIYSEFLKQKNYKEALPAWRHVFNNAPKFQMLTYTKGEDLLINIYQQTKDKTYVDTLMMLYDQWAKYFGDHQRYGEGYILGKKGATLYRFGGDDTKKTAFSYLAKSFELEGNKTHPITVQTMFFGAGDLLKKGELSKDEYIALYMKVSGFIDDGIKNAKQPKTVEAFKTMKGNVDAMFFNAGVADCETLNNLLSAKYEANKEDVANLKEVASLLRRNVSICLYMQL